MGRAPPNLDESKLRFLAGSRQLSRGLPVKHLVLMLFRIPLETAHIVYLLAYYG